MVKQNKNGNKEFYLSKILKGVRSAISIGDYIKAEDTLRIADKSYPDNPQVKVHFSNLYIKKGMIDQAKTYAQEALKLDITNLDANRTLGNIFYEEAQQKEQSLDIRQARRAYIVAAKHFRSAFIYSSLRFRYRLLTRKAFNDYLRLTHPEKEAKKRFERYDSRLDELIKKALERLKRKSNISFSGI